MEPDKSASFPLSGEKSNLGQAVPPMVPPPYQDNTTSWGQQPGQYQGPGYEQQMYPGQTVVVQPQLYVIPTPLENPANDYLGYSIFTMLCCCLPLGVAALVYSILTRSANDKGNQLEAEQKSRMAKTLNHVALGLGIGFIIIVIIIQALGASG